jgi:hypothetical protein
MGHGFYRFCSVDPTIRRSKKWTCFLGTRLESFDSYLPWDRHPTCFKDLANTNGIHWLETMAARCSQCDPSWILLDLYRMAA